jgi:hypothetical protein
MAGRMAKSSGAARKRQPAKRETARRGSALAQLRTEKAATVEARRARGSWWLRIEGPVEATAALAGE